MHKPQPFVEVDGAKIREKRQDLGLEAQEVADAVRISRRYLNYIENGYRRRLSSSKYGRLRRALKASKTELLPDPPGSDHPPKE